MELVHAVPVMFRGQSRLAMANLIYEAAKSEGLNVCHKNVFPVTEAAAAAMYILTHCSELNLKVS